MNDDRVDEVKKNILSPSQWVRILYMVFYAVACWVLLFVIPIIIVCQVIIALITGMDNRNLRDFGASLSAYFHSALDYLLYVNDEKPWPFVSDDDDDLDDELNDVSSKQKPAASKQQQQSADNVFSDISFTENSPDNASEDSPASDDLSQTSGDLSEKNESDGDLKDPAN